MSSWKLCEKPLKFNQQLNGDPNFWAQKESSGSLEKWKLQNKNCNGQGIETFSGPFGHGMGKAVMPFC